MKINKAYKFRLEPNAEQGVMSVLRGWFGIKY